MYTDHVIVTTKHGRMPAFVACPDGDGPFPPVILYMDAPGTREELRNHARRIARHGYFCILPDMYYRLGTILFDLTRRDDAMSGVVRAAMNSINNALVTEDTAGILSWLDAQDRVKPGPVGCIGHCMSGQYVTTLSAKFPHRMACAASLYGVGIVTDKPDSPHLLLAGIKGEMYYAFAETDASVPDHVIPDLRAALAKTDVRHTIKVFPGAHHGFQFAERPAPSYNTVASEQAWADIFAMLDRHLK